MTRIRKLAGVVSFFTLFSCLLAANETPPADRIITNANIHTLDSARPRAEALAMRQGRLIAVGAAADVLPFRGPATRVDDLAGRTVLPGLIDAHGHMAGLGSFALGRIDLSHAKSFDEVVAEVQERVRKARPGDWILGGRWDHESWPDHQLPTHQKLSAISPNNPVWLTRVDGHAGLANEAAMQRAGIVREAANPPGGEIIRDARGEPTGVFVDNAESLIAGKIDQPIADTVALLRKAQELCLSVGLTGVHDAGDSPADVDAYARLRDAGELKLRVYCMIHGQVAQEYFATHERLIGERLTVRAAKLYADGAMGSRGAWLLAPYADRPTDDHGQPYTGLAVMAPEVLRQVAADGMKRGYQVCTHAIGDRGNRETLDAYEAALKGVGAVTPPDHRFRVEHAQLLSLDDIPRFRSLGVIPSMQPTHCTSDMRWVDVRVGAERARGAYAWASLLKTGVRIAAGSDFPVESHNPFLGIYAAITRQDPNGSPPGGWHPDQRLTRTEALRAFTLDAAYAAFEENEKGSLTVGKLADFIVIDRDVLTCDVRAILETRVLQTVIGGEAVFTARSTSPAGPPK